MEDIKIGQIRKWKTDTNNEHFEIIEDNGTHYGTHYWIIQYTTDGRKQTKAEDDFVKSVLCDD